MKKSSAEYILAIHTVERALELLCQIPDGVLPGGKGYTPQRNLTVAKSDLAALLRMEREK